MGRFAMVTYAPHTGHENALAKLITEHLPLLRKQGLATNRPSLIMRAANGHIVEVFEWVSAQAIEQAHNNPDVQALWAAFQAACTFKPLASLPETHDLFAEFEAYQPSEGL